MMGRLHFEEFTHDGKNFMYIDMAGLKVSEEITELVAAVQPAIAKYPEGSLYTITNLENAKFDTEMKQIMIDYLKHNKPYVKYGAIIGFDGVVKIVANMMFTLTGRSNILFAFTREQAVEFLLEKE